jgi:membrane protein required for colicin V production
MATVDIVCIVALVLFAILGAWRGFISQVTSLVAFVLIALCATPLGVKVANMIVESGEWEADAIRNLKIGMSIAAAVLIFIVVKLIGALLNRSIGRAEPTEDDNTPGMAPWNRWWGAAFGVLKAAVLCWLVLCFFVAFPKLSTSVAAGVGESWAGRTVSLFNPIDLWMEKDERAGMEDALVALWKLKKHPGAFTEVAKEDSVREVLDHPRVRELLDEGKGDLIGALTDKGFRQSLKDVNWPRIADIAEDALEEAEEKAEEKDD